LLFPTIPLSAKFKLVRQSLLSVKQESLKAQNFWSQGRRYSDQRDEQKHWEHQAPEAKAENPMFKEHRTGSLL
jgi:hypothetical protein